MNKRNCTLKASPMRVHLGLTCVVCVLAACSPASSTSNTTGDAAGSGLDKSLADAPPPAAALPLAIGPAPASSPAPAASALPPAPNAPLGRIPTSDQYAYLNEAYAFSQSLADAPPDYTYDYQGEEPWVWQSPDGYARVVERLPMGVRYFYYAPGASTPYLVQDPQYAYGYSGGLLTVVYGPGGEVLPYGVEVRQAQLAGVYLAWGAGLYAAVRHGRHVSVSQVRWNAERQSVYADQARWRAAQQRNPGWATYNQLHRDDEAHWAGQRYVRAAEAARFAQAVHDQTALARAQQAAAHARTSVLARGERPPGPPPVGEVDRHEPGVGPIRVSGPAEGDIASAKVRDRGPTDVRANPGVQQQIERPSASKGAHDARERNAVRTAPDRQGAVQGHAAQIHHGPALDAEKHTASAPAATEARRQSAEPSGARVQAQRSDQATEDRKSPQARAPAPAHVEAPHPAPNPPKPPGEPKHKPDQPHP